MKGRCLTYEMERDAEKKMLETLTPEENEKYMAEQNELFKELKELIRKILEERKTNKKL